MRIQSEWDGIISSKLLKEDYIKTRHKISDYAKNFDWYHLLNEMDKSGGLLVNSVRLDGTACYTPLHQAVFGNASLEVIKKLIEFGAWRSYRNSDGETPLDMAIKKKATYLYEILTPNFWFNFNPVELHKIEQNFHQVILDRIKNLSVADGLQLPQLSILFENEPHKIWFAVPRMYGGFNFWWDSIDNHLVSESWSRIVGGSGQRHFITSNEIIIAEAGFI